MEAAGHTNATIESMDYDSISLSARLVPGVLGAGSARLV